MDACDEMVICNAEMAARDVSLAPFATEWTKKSRKASHRSSKPSSDATAGKCAREFADAAEGERQSLVPLFRRGVSAVMHQHDDTFAILRADRRVLFLVARRRGARANLVQEREENVPQAIAPRARRQFTAVRRQRVDQRAHAAVSNLRSRVHARVAKRGEERHDGHLRHERARLR